MKAHRCKMANESKMADHSTSFEYFLQEAKQNPYLEKLQALQLSTFINLRENDIKCVLSFLNIKQLFHHLTAELNAININKVNQL